MDSKFMSALPFRGKNNTEPAKGEEEGSFRADSLPNTNGFVPFKRMIIVWAILLTISAALGPLAWEQILLTRPPENTLDPSGLFVWALMSMVIPHLIVYILAVFTTYAIIPQSTMKYMGWLTKESMGKLIVNYFIMEAIILMVIIGGMLGLPENAYFQIVENTGGMTQTSSFLWNTSFFAMTVPAWVGYSTAWKSYRLLGAQTMQSRYESHLRETEIKNSGQWWDRVVKLRIPAFFGWDGNSPKFMIAWFVIANIFMAFILAPANVLEISLLYGVGIFGSPTLIIALFAAISKRRDGKISHRRPQYLVAVRGPETEDTYDPAKTGVRQFERY